MNEMNPVHPRPNPVQQVDPSGKDYAYYKIAAGDLVLAELIAVNNGSASYGFEKLEYWRFNDGLLQIDSCAYDRLQVTKAAHAWSDGQPPFSVGKAQFICSLTPEWGALAPSSPVQGHCYDDGWGLCGFSLNISRASTGSEWVGTIHWVRPTLRFAPLFEQKDYYSLAHGTLDQGETVTNRVGTFWTPPLVNYGDGTWKAVVLEGDQKVTGIQVGYGGDHYGITDARLVFGNNTYSAWTSDDGGTLCPSDDKANLGQSITTVRILTGYYLNYSLGPVNLDCGNGMVTPWAPNASGSNDISAVIPSRCRVVGLQGKKRDNYGLVDIKIAYREVP